jgi:hypothetical protein
MSFHNTDSVHCRLFENPDWLEYPHDGHEPVSLREYLGVRPKKESSNKYLAAAYQSMLTFGLLEAVIEAPVSEDMLVHKDQSGKLVMSTSRLIEIIRDWLSRIEQTQPHVLALWFKRARENLRLAHSIMILFTTRRFEMFEPLGDAIPSMVCFIAIIAEALVNAHTRMVVGSPMPREGFSWSMIWTPPIREALRRDLHADGWCPSTIEYLANTKSVSSLRYICDQGPLDDGKDHFAHTADRLSSKSSLALKMVMFLSSASILPVSKSTNRLTCHTWHCLMYGQMDLGAPRKMDFRYANCND